MTIVWPRRRRIARCSDPLVVRHARTVRGGEISAVLVLIAALCGCGGAGRGSSAATCAAERDVVLASRADIAAFAACSTAHRVAIRSGAALHVSALRALTDITGDLVIGPTTAIEQIDLAGLRSVGGAVRVIANGLLQRVQLSSLERAGSIDIAGNPALAAIALPRLSVVHGAVRVTDSASLELLDIAALAAIDGALAISDVPALTLVEAGQLQRAASVQLDAPKLTPEVADRLRASAAR